MHLFWINFFLVFLTKSILSSPTSHLDPTTVGDFKSLRKYVNQLEQDVRELTFKLKNTEQRLEVIEHSGCVKFCNVLGTIYIHGANFTSNCDICICSFGKVECKPKHCPLTNCKHPELLPGECCAKCKRKCFFENESYEHGDEIKLKYKDKCISCICNDGNMKCNKIDPKCPKLKCSIEEQSSIDDGCCNYCPGTDFCSENHNCDHNAKCHNLRTKFQCTCNFGFKGNGTYCKDVNECLHKGGLDGHFCHLNTRCENTFGSYKCACLPGFEKKDSYNCIDIDECKIGIHKCDKNSICINTLGGYRCECLPNFKLINGECKSKCDDCCKHDNDSKLIFNGQINTTACSNCNCKNANLKSFIYAQASVANSANIGCNRITIYIFFLICIIQTIIQVLK